MTKTSRRVAIAALGLAAALPASALLLLNELPGTKIDQDLRGITQAPSPQALAAAQQLGSRVEWNAFGTVESLISHGGFIADGFDGNVEEVARAFIAQNRALFGLSEASVGALKLVSIGATPGNAGKAVLFRQDFMGMPVTLDGQITIGVKGGAVYYVSSSSAGDQPPMGPASLSALDAWLIAANNVRLNLREADVLQSIDRSATKGWHLFNVTGFPQEQRARLVVVPMPGGGVRQAYETIVVKSSAAEVFAYVHFIDAQTGQVLRRENRVDWQSPPSTTPFNGALASADTCGPKHNFAVPAGQGRIEVQVAAANPANDIKLNLYHNGTLVLSGDLATSPETISYAPNGGVPAGSYDVEVCPFAAGQLPPLNYAGSFTYTEAAAPATFSLPTWSWFTAYPNVDYSSADIRNIGCWTATGNDCDILVDSLASRFPWDVQVNTGQSSNTTIGNNAQTAESWGSPLTPSTPYRPTTPSRSYRYPFTNVWNTSGCGPDNFVTGVGNDIDAAISNLFVTHNRMHDWSYFLGFTEQNSNLQTNNFGMTGTQREGDPEIGNVQAGAVSGHPTSPSFFTAPGRDNANQITLQDGVPGITNQYLFQSLGGSLYVPCADADYDMSVIGHEYTHAITSRMIGGPDAGIGGHQGRAMGESWGDLGAAEHMIEFGYLPVQDENPTAVGPYATGNKQTGIRNFSLDNNPLNYSNVGYDTPGPAVHSDGEIWNGTQWDVRQALVEAWNDRFPHTDLQRQKDCAEGKYLADACPGNRRWIQMMYDSFLLIPASPSMLATRDGMLASDVARFNGENQATMWKAFAKRGMGIDAFTNGADDTDPVANFESPLHPASTVTFAVLDGSTNAPITNAKIYVGRFIAGTSPLADTDPTTVVDTTSDATRRATLNLGGSARMIAGTYDFIVSAPGFGMHRFDGMVINGDATASFTLPVNYAAKSRGASVAITATVAENVAAKDSLIDEDENTGVRFDDSVPIAGGNAIVTLAGGPIMVTHVNVSTAASPQSPGRFTALRKFEILLCNGTCGVPADFTLAYTSEDNAFPSTVIRPAQHTLNLRSFTLTTPALATHVMLRALTNQCLGAPEFAGDKDQDPAVNADCPTTNIPATAGVDALGGSINSVTQPNSVVRGSELQVFGAVPASGSSSGSSTSSSSSSSSSGSTSSSSSSSSGGSTSSSSGSTSSSSGVGVITPTAPGKSDATTSHSKREGRFGGGALGLGVLALFGLGLWRRRFALR